MDSSRSHKHMGINYLKIKSLIQVEEQSMRRQSAPTGEGQVSQTPKCQGVHCLPPSPVLGFEPAASGMVGKRSTRELCPSPDCFENPTSSRTQSVQSLPTDFISIS